MSTRMPKPVRVATRQADGRLVYAHGQAPVTPCSRCHGNVVEKKDHAGRSVMECDRCHTRYAR